MANLNQNIGFLAPGIIIRHSDVTVNIIWLKSLAKVGKGKFLQTHHHSISDISVLGTVSSEIPCGNVPVSYDWYDLMYITSGKLEEIWQLVIRNNSTIIARQVNAAKGQAGKPYINQNQQIQLSMFILDFTVH